MRTGVPHSRITKTSAHEQKILIIYDVLAKAKEVQRFKIQLNICALSRQIPPWPLAVKILQTFKLLTKVLAYASMQLNWFVSLL